MAGSDIYRSLAKIEGRFREILKNPRLTIKLSPQWGAEHATHRQDIRQGILKEVPWVNSQEILNLDLPPAMPSTSPPLMEGLSNPQFSVSHTMGLGGFGVSFQGSVGFDIELVDRVTSRIAERVAIGHELDLAPSPASLWVAKEAAFKGLRPVLQPRTISQIETIHWEKVDSLFDTYELSHSESYGSFPGSGCVFCDGHYAIGIFTVNTKE